MKIGLLNLALDLYKLGVFSRLNKVADLGSKDLRLSYDDLKYSLDQVNIKIKNKNFDILKRFPKGERISTENFWKLLNVKDYKCFDINKSNKAIYQDLNYPLKNKKYNNKFDLVNDFGNNEHIFNIGQAYKTMYDLCKKDGYMWIFQSVHGGNGFYNFDQSFFEGMAAANSLSIVYMAYVINFDEYKQYLIPCDKDLLKKFNLNLLNCIDITCVFKKKTQNEFKYYYQYNLNNKVRPFKRSFISNNYPPEKVYIPEKSIKEQKRLAKKNNKNSIDWLRALGYKV